jgi:hypothetical protein
MLAHRRRARWQRTLGGVTIERTLAGHRPLAADVERGERVHLPGIRHADDHAELLLHGGVGRRRLHAPVFQRRPLVLVEVGQDRRGFHGLRREAQRRRRARRAARFRHRRAVRRHEQARHPVEGAGARDVVPDHRDASRLSGLDRVVQRADRRLFETEWRV